MLRPGIQNMATMTTNHDALTMGQIETISLPHSSHYFFPSHYGQVPFFFVQNSIFILYLLRSTSLTFAYDSS